MTCTRKERRASQLRALAVASAYTLVASLCRPARAAGTDAPSSDFGACWHVSLGAEFPGAQATLDAADAATEQALALHYDFRAGGLYVAAVCELTKPRVFRYLGLRARVPDNVHLGARVRDASGQWLQYRVHRPLAALDPDAWFHTTLELTEPERYWGGADDGHVHGALAAVVLFVEKVTANATGRVSFDALESSNALAVTLDPNAAVEPTGVNDAGAATVADTAAHASRGLFDGFGVALHRMDDDQALDAAKSAGVHFARIDLFWERFEPTQGHYDFGAADRFVAALESRGMTPLFILGLGHPMYGGGPPRNPATIQAFAAFARAAAAHFAGHAARYELWNEPNIARFWPPAPDARAAAELELAAEHAVHAGDPSALVVTGGLSWFDLPFLRAFLDDGGAGGAQAVGVHPYRGTRAPESLADDLVDARRVLRAASGRALPLWDTEWGYATTQFGPGHSDAARARQAIFAVRALLAARVADLPVAVWYDLRDDGTNASDAEQNFGLLASDGTPKPALTALRALHATALGRAFSGTFALGAPLVNGVALDGTIDRKVVLWSTTDDPVSVRTPRPAAASDLFGAPLPLAEQYTLEEARGPIVLTFITTHATGTRPVSPGQLARTPPAHSLTSRGCSCTLATREHTPGLAAWTALFGLATLRRRRAR